MKFAQNVGLDLKLMLNPIFCQFGVPKVRKNGLKDQTIGFSKNIFLVVNFVSLAVEKCSLYINFIQEICCFSFVWHYLCF